MLLRLGVLPFVAVCLSLADWSTSSPTITAEEAVTGNGDSPPKYEDRLIRFTWNNDTRIDDETLDYFESRHDVWRRTRNSIDVRLLETEKADGVNDDGGANSVFKTLFMKRDLISVDVVIPSIQDVIDLPTVSTETNLNASEESVSGFLAKKGKKLDPSHDPIHSTYHSYANIVAIMDKLVAGYPDYARPLTLGTSSQGNAIRAIQIGPFSKHKANDNDPTAQKKKKKKTRGVMIIGTQHAREWISASTALYFAHSLLISTEANPSKRVRKLSRFFDGSLPSSDVVFTIVPVVNVDGYLYTWSEDRLWRKNRQDLGVVSGTTTKKKSCVGIDLNRNWGYKWAPGSKKASPCSDAYVGSGPFQAPELQAIASFIKDKSTNNIVSFVDLHSFGQMLLFPYSYSCTDISSDAEDLFEAVVGASTALRHVHGMVFDTGSACSLSLSGPGDSVDWTYGAAGITWSFSFELRDLGVFGFLLPSSQIVPSGEEITAALASLTDFVIEKEDKNRFQVQWYHPRD